MCFQWVEMRGGDRSPSPDRLVHVRADHATEETRHVPLHYELNYTKWVAELTAGRRTVRGIVYQGVRHGDYVPVAGAG